MCKAEFSPFKLKNEQKGQELAVEFCCLSHLGAWLINNLGSQVTSLLSFLSTAEGRKTAAKALIDKAF
jgi:hypothetical protein